MHRCSQNIGNTCGAIHSYEHGQTALLDCLEDKRTGNGIHQSHNDVLADAAKVLINESAHDDKASPKEGQFSGDDTCYRRYTGE